MLLSLDAYLHTKNLSCQLIPTWDIGHKKIPQSDRTRGKTGYTQPNMVVTYANFCWWLYLHVKNLRYWLTASKNPVIRLDTTETPKHKWQSQMLLCLRDSLHVNNLRYRLIPSWDTDDQSLLQSGWIWDTPSHTQPKAAVSGPNYPWWLSPC